MDIGVILAATLLFTVLMDPLGNLPVFVMLLRRQTPARYIRIVFRESLIALALMLAALSLGRYFMKLLHITPDSMGIAGGLILLLIGIKMVFSPLSKRPEESVDDEPFVVPLAVPLICGPGVVAVLVTLPQRGELPAYVLALLAAWVLQLLTLAAGKKIAKLLGDKLLEALESLMGLLLTSMAVGMIIENIRHLQQ